MTAHRDHLISGSDTARVQHASADEKARRVRIVTSARHAAADLAIVWHVGSLAAAKSLPLDDPRLVAARRERDWLIDVLGLVPSEAATPGVCRCGVQLPVAAIVGRAGGRYTAGHCAACSKTVRESRETP